MRVWHARALALRCHIKKVDIGNADIGLRRANTSRRMPYPFALRQDKKLSAQDEGVFLTNC